jgi:hypothetical protein
LKNFIKDGDKYIFSKLPPEFIGFASSDGINEKIHDLIKDAIPIQKKFPVVINRTLRVL